MLHENKKNNDQIANSLGQNGYARRQRQPEQLLFTLLTSRLYTTPAIRHTGTMTVSKNRLSWYNPDAQGLLRPAKSTQLKESTTLLHPLLYRKTAGKKRAFESLLNAIFDQAEAIGLLDEKKTAAVDATGLESRHTSGYYVRRKGYKRFRRCHWPKITVVCDTQTHLFAGCIVSRGPSNDSPEFAPVVIQASQFVQFDQLLADAAYDGEHNHRLCRERLGIVETIIPLNTCGRAKRRSRKWPKGKYRRQMKEHFDKEQYNQRLHIESAFSQNKRLLGSALRARTDQSRERECFLRILTHTLMIIRRSA
jgi:transposase